MFRYILLAVLTVITNMTKYHYLTLCSWLLLVGRSYISWEIDARTYTHTLRKKPASVVWWIIYVLVKDTISVHSCPSIWIGSSNLSLKSKCIHHTTYLLVLSHSNVPGLLNWIWHLLSLDLLLICKWWMTESFFLGVISRSQTLMSRFVSKIRSRVKPTTWKVKLIEY